MSFWRDPRVILYGLSGFLQGDEAEAQGMRIDTRRAAHEFDISWKMTFEEGLRWIVDWYRHHSLMLQSNMARARELRT
jgi:dTDP-D-glucose 4,6-dehydratase